MGKNLEYWLDYLGHYHLTRDDIRSDVHRFLGDIEMITSANDAQLAQCLPIVIECIAEVLRLVSDQEVAARAVAQVYWRIKAPPIGEL